VCVCDYTAHPLFSAKLGKSHTCVK